MSSAVALLVYGAVLVAAALLSERYSPLVGIGSLIVGIAVARLLLP